MEKYLKDYKNYNDLDLEEFIKDLGEWKKLFETYLDSNDFKDLYKKVDYEYKNSICYPPKNLVFNAFKLTKLENIKVVIVGQDPYHQKGQAMGLCFSVNKHVKIPKSLANIYKCLKNDTNINNFKAPTHGDLTYWSEQGVFLLNDVLTVKDSSPNSHQKFGWRKFTDLVIEKINSELKGVIFLLWGNFAKKKAIKVDSKKHYILESTHPSPFSAHNGFLTCQHFSKVNEILRNNNKKEIDWNLE